MTKDFPGEKWKTVAFDFKYVNKYQLEVSNYGRLRTTNKLFSNQILNGSLVNGYKIIRLKFFSKRDPAVEKQLSALEGSVSNLLKKIKKLAEGGAKKADLKPHSEKLTELRRKLKTMYAEDTRNRTIYYQKLVHRIVAENFLPKPSASKTIVAHLDYDKLNNKAANLRWMTPDENYAHQKKSPFVIAEKKLRQVSRQRPSSTTKLTAAKVGQLKKLLNQGKPIRHLVNKFGVTDTQILRIKRGENWGNIPASK